MAACTFDMQFTYILAGWEGSAVDSHVLKSTLTRRDKIYVPEGKYYLLEAGYANLLGFLAPYRARFKILKDAPPFDFDVQVNIVIACCVLHNYISMEDHMDLFEDEEDDSSDDFGGEDCEANNESDIEDSDNSDDVEDDVDTQRSTQKESAVQSARASYY
ncbi:uncharacterized protein [Aristolochia californica]|uniref:uncharacterized protein n=1 Tax=Aristolochia californica TaxID=171875 RepID=UPI0035E1D97B